MNSTALRSTAILVFVLSVFLIPVEATGQHQPGESAQVGREARLAPAIADCQSNAGDTPASNPLATRKSFPISNPDMLDLGVLGHWNSPRLNMTCQYGAYCPSTYCTSLRTECSNQGGSYTETFIGKCCASPSDSSYARFVCVRKGVTLIDQYCRY